MGKLTDKILLLILVFVISLVYWRVTNGFFQQDEWNGFAWFILNQKSTFLETLSYFFTIDVGHYNPFAISIQYSLYLLWGLDYLKFSLIGIFLHSAVTVAVYYLAKILFDGKRIFAFFTAISFGLFASTYQGVSWSVVNISTLGAALFGVISAISFFSFLKNNKSNYLTLSIIFFIISILFKETTIGLFPLYLLLARKKRILVAATGAIYILFRIVLLFISRENVNMASTSQGLNLIILNFLTLPIKSVSQLLIPAELLKSVSFYLAELFPINLTGIPGSPEFEAFAVRVVLAAASLIIGLSVIFITYLKFRKPLPLIGLGWVIVNSLIFSLAPETRESVLLVDSRNLYFTSVGFSIFLVSLVDVITKENGRKLAIIVTLLVILNLFWLNRNLSKIVEEGEIRKNILSTIKNSHPDLPEKVIFYIESDTSYYGLPEHNKILPFQSGFGQTLLVYYHDKENFPKEFFSDRFLWEITSQGYMELEDRGFGFFRDKKLLKNYVIRYNLPKDSIIAYSWIGEIELLTDMTENVRSEMAFP